MNKIFDNKQEFTELYRDAVMSISGKSVEAASDLDRFNALAKLVAEKARTVATKSDARATAEGKKRVYYFSIEFLIGRLLDNYLLNFGVRDMVAEALDDMGFDLSVIENQEPDPALGNGGLGRLAACFLDSMAAEGIAGYGNGMRYRYGLFKQEIVNGSQVEATDEWLTHGYPWEVRRQDKAVTIKFGGRVEGFEEDGRTFYRTVDTQDILAVPYDIPVVGYAGETVNKLRVWAAEPVEEHFDLEAFNRGDYALADAERAEAEAISAILYPNDAGEHGRLLRLKQEYLFVSAGIYSLLDTFEKEHGENWELLPQFVAIHTNDTHPAMCGPELMRILIDEEGLEWDEAWEVTTKTCAYTNHTIMAEALEKWPIELFSRLLPRIYQIVEEINRRFVLRIQQMYPGNQEKIRKMAIIYDGQVKMAHLAIVGGHSVNGVARLHTEILEKQELRDFYEMMPEKFNNKTNGITQRRFLLHANPLLADWVTDHVGDEWITDLPALSKLRIYADDEKAQQEFMNIKYQNKVRLAKYIREHNGIEVDPRSIFDVQVKRLHEYKRQLMNILHIMYLYNELKDHPDMDFYPRTFIFGAKAAAGYRNAKLTIKLINSVADVINNDPVVDGRIKVVFIENYRVSNAEWIFAAADVSEQISTASKEASGTGNMKFMLNGALTLGTMDGANVEIVEEVGKENAFIFGLSAEQVIQYENYGGYNPMDIFNNDQDIRRVLMQLINGTYSPQDPELFRPLYNSLLNTQDTAKADTYFILADFKSYAEAQRRVEAAYKDEKNWAKSALLNVACAGKFSSDRTIEEYERDIWHQEKVILPSKPELSK